ncbi:ESX-1 secretion-associated protein [Micromonospora sp. RHAY321]|uniref:type VII secretion target n=1 Tax=unclassified Micromonospora TaxID=2617518 RepID=UPI00207D0D25|nr:type VII secretion target [Micromonospora sp. RHAY321]MCO1598388.1 ESX-1 secretion-associated protein [Micromonospora sp. RHAY321]
MPENLQVHPPALRQGGSHLTEVAEQLAAQWEALRARTAAMGDIFGDDDVGGLIGMSYQAAEEIAAECLGSVVEGLRGFGDGLGLMADQYDLVEQDNDAQFTTMSW